MPFDKAVQKCRNVEEAEVRINRQVLDQAKLDLPETRNGSNLAGAASPNIR